MSEPVTAISTRFTNRSAAAGLILTRAERTVCPPGLSAITRFMTDQGISMRMHAIDDLGIYGRKQKGNNQVVVDWSRWPRKIASLSCPLFHNLFFAEAVKQRCKTERRAVSRAARARATRYLPGSLSLKGLLRSPVTAAFERALQRGETQKASQR
eukprot:5007300-Prymnesium_polylepis.2